MKNSYIGVNNQAKKIKDIYVGVDGIAKKVVKAYIGVDGIAKLWWSDETVGYVIFENGIFNYVPDGFNIDNYVEDNDDVENLNNYYLAGVPLWVHDLSVIDSWIVNELNIDSRYYNFEDPYDKNILFIPINRIKNPEQLKVTARGDLAFSVGSIENGIMTVSSDGWVYDNSFNEYTLDISANSYIDYIILSNRLSLTTKKPDNFFDGSTNYINSILYYQPDTLTATNKDPNLYLEGDLRKQYQYEITEGYAYAVVFKKDDEQIAHVIFFSDIPFTISVFDPSLFAVNTQICHTLLPRNVPIYYSDAFNVYIGEYFVNSNINIILDELAYDGQGSENSNINAGTATGFYFELASYIYPVLQRHPTINFDTDKSLQQISRIEVVGGELGTKHLISLHTLDQYITQKFLLYISNNQELIFETYTDSEDNRERKIIITEQQDEVYSIWWDIYVTGNPPLVQPIRILSPRLYSKKPFKYIDTDNYERTAIQQTFNENFTYYDGASRNWVDSTVKVKLIQPTVVNKLFFNSIDDYNNIDYIGILAYHILTGNIKYGYEGENIINFNSSESEEPITPDPVEPEPEPISVIDDEYITGYFEQPIEFITEGNLEFANKTIEIQSGYVGFIYKDEITSPNNVRYSGIKISKNSFSSSATLSDAQKISGKYYYASITDTAWIDVANDTTVTNISPAPVLIALNNQALRIKALWEAAYIADQRGLFDTN